MPGHKKLVGRLAFVARVIGEKPLLAFRTLTVYAGSVLRARRHNRRFPTLRPLSAACLPLHRWRAVVSHRSGEAVPVGSDAVINPPSTHDRSVMKLPRVQVFTPLER